MNMTRDMLQQYHISIFLRLPGDEGMTRPYWMDLFIRFFQLFELSFQVKCCRSAEINIARAYIC
jgi:hypothetical protein